MAKYIYNKSGGKRNQTMIIISKFVVSPELNKNDIQRKAGTYLK